MTHVTDIEFQLSDGVMTIHNMATLEEVDAVCKDLLKLGTSAYVKATNVETGELMVRSESGGWNSAGAAEPPLSRSPNDTRIKDTSICDYGFGTVNNKGVASFFGEGGCRFDVSSDSLRLTQLPSRILAKVVYVCRDEDGFWEDSGDYEVVDVTDAILSMSSKNITSIRDNDTTSDNLAYNAGCPWPFRVEVTDSIQRYFDMPDGTLKGDKYNHTALHDCDVEQCRFASGTHRHQTQPSNTL